MTMNPFYDRVSFVLTWEGTSAGPPACQRSQLLPFVHCSSEPFIKFLGWNFCTCWKVSYEIYKYLHTYVHEAINARAINTRQRHLCERNIGCAPSRCRGDAQRVSLRLRQSPLSGASCCQVFIVLFLTSCSEQPILLHETIHVAFDRYSKDPTAVVCFRHNDRNHQR